MDIEKLQVELGPSKLFVLNPGDLLPDYTDGSVIVKVGPKGRELAETMPGKRLPAEMFGKVVLNLRDGGWLFLDRSAFQLDSDQELANNIDLGVVEKYRFGAGEFVPPHLNGSVFVCDHFGDYNFKYGYSAGQHLPLTMCGFVEYDEAGSFEYYLRPGDRLPKKFKQKVRVVHGFSGDQPDYVDLRPGELVPRHLDGCVHLNFETKIATHMPGKQPWFSEIEQPVDFSAFSQAREDWQKMHFAESKYKSARDDAAKFWAHKLYWDFFEKNLGLKKLESEEDQPLYSKADFEGPEDHEEPQPVQEMFLSGDVLPKRMTGVVSVVVGSEYVLLSGGDRVPGDVVGAVFVGVDGVSFYRHVDPESGPVSMGLYDTEAGWKEKLLGALVRRKLPDRITVKHVLILCLGSFLLGLAAVNPTVAKMVQSLFSVLVPGAMT